MGSVVASSEIKRLGELWRLKSCLDYVEQDVRRCSTLAGHLLQAASEALFVEIRKIEAGEPASAGTAGEDNAPSYDGNVIPFPVETV